MSNVCSVGIGVEGVGAISVEAMAVRSVSDR